MSGKSKKNKKPSDRKNGRGAEKGPAPEASGQEERSAEVATIGWMLTTLATLVGLLCSLGAFLLVQNFPKPPPSLELLPGLLLVVSALSGLVAVGLTPLVIRLRKTQPPRAVTRTAVIVGAFPTTLLLVLEFIY